MVVIPLEEGLPLSVLTRGILKNRNSTIYGLTLFYESTDSAYKYIVIPINDKGYIEMDKDWFSWEIQRLISYEDPEYEKKKKLLSSLSYIIPIKDYIDSYDLQLAVDLLLAESNYQTPAKGIFMVSENIKGTVFLKFWYTRSRRDLYEIKTRRFS